MIHQRQQTLVRFDNRTYVIQLPPEVVASPFNAAKNLLGKKSEGKNDDDEIIYVANILKEISERTGWLTDQLIVTHLDRNNHGFQSYCNVKVQSRIVGGKGGFGTLLKGQSRQAGAKVTTNFDACRDLQGRRLQHVNELLQYNTWKEWSDKVASGAATEEDMVKALLLDQANDSGIAGWHLQLPSWAEVSMKREVQKNKRIFYLWKRQMKQKRELRVEQQQLQQGIIDSYVEAADVLTDQASSSVSDSFQKGYRKLTAQKRKRTMKVGGKSHDQQLDSEVGDGATADNHNENANKTGDTNPQVEQPDPPSSFVTLSGEIVMEYQLLSSSSPTQSSNNEINPYTWLLQSKSNFATVGILLDQMNLNVKSRQNSAKCFCCYYEVCLVTTGIVQIGWSWFHEGTSNFHPNSELGDGVGDDSYSWAFDVRRKVKLHNNTTETYGSCEIAYDDSNDNVHSGNPNDSKVISNEKYSSTINNTLTNPSHATVVGCIWNYYTGELSFSVDGVDCGIAFQLPNLINLIEANDSNQQSQPSIFPKVGNTIPADEQQREDQQIQNQSGRKENSNDAENQTQTAGSSPVVVYPAVSLNESEIVELRLNASQCQYMPISTTDIEVIAIGDVMVTDIDDSRTLAAPLVLECHKSENEHAVASSMQSQNDDEVSNPAGISFAPQYESIVQNTELNISKLDLSQYETIEQLQQLGLERLKGALIAIGLKCGGTLEERAKRLFSVKGLEPHEFPSKLKAKTQS